MAQQQLKYPPYWQFFATNFTDEQRYATLADNTPKNGSENFAGQPYQMSFYKKFGCIAPSR